MTNQLTMRKAHANEAMRVMEIINDGKKAIAKLGIEQWQFGYPNLEGITADIANGYCYVAEDADGALLGTLALCAGSDPEYSQADIPWITHETATEPVPYAAIHRCASAHEAAHKGVATFMFTQAEVIARAHGKKSIRIDTHPKNVRMRSFLPKLGYTELGGFDLKTKNNGETDLYRIAYEKLL